MTQSLDISRIQKLIWAYFFLLIFEGALRKWVFPSLATPLLLIRDPVVLAIYFLLWRSNLFPRNAFIDFVAVLAFLCLIAGLIAPESSPLVAIYGFRANFLHLPLIFIIPKVFTTQDVKQMGRWILLLSMPMAALMVAQFNAPPEAWINAGDDPAFRQLESALGHVRAPGTFSFISGPVYFFSLVAAFLLHGQFSRNQYAIPLQCVSLVALLVACVVSGSRSLVGAVAIVFICAFFIGGVLRPWLLFRWLWVAGLIASIFFLLQDVEFFREGLKVFDARLDAAAKSGEGEAGGFFVRFVAGFTDPLWKVLEAPLLGHGLGMGTNGGSVLLTGKVQFLLDEGEWGRILLESGPLLGGTFILWRICLMLWIGSHSLKHALRDNALPMLLFGACSVVLLNGGFGQPTSLGFAVLSSGLCLAAMRLSAPATNRVPATISAPKTLAADAGAASAASSAATSSAL